MFFHWFVLTSGKILATPLVWINYRTGRESISKIKSTGLLSGETHVLFLINTCKIDARHLQLFLVEDDPQGRNHLSRSLQDLSFPVSTFHECTKGKERQWEWGCKENIDFEKKKRSGARSRSPPELRSLLSIVFWQ